MYAATAAAADLHIDPNRLVPHRRIFSSTTKSISISASTTRRSCMLIGFPSNLTSLAHLRLFSSSPPKDWDPFVKQTYSAWVNTENGNRKWHLSEPLPPSFSRFPSLTALKRRTTPNGRRITSEPLTTSPRSATSWSLRDIFSATRTSDPISLSTRSRTTLRGRTLPCTRPQNTLIRHLHRIHTTTPNHPHTLRCQPCRKYLQMYLLERN